MKFYGYWRSSASYRVRIALNLKGIDVETIAINLREAEHKQDRFRQTNPAGFVPVLELTDGTRIDQSFAILNYLERAFPKYPLLPEDNIARARCEAFILSINSEIHPLQNLRVLKYLRNDLNLPETEVQAWITRWIMDGFHALETQVKNRDTHFLFGEKPGMAECYLIPQIYNAERFHINMQNFPTLKSINDMCTHNHAFSRALPDHQPDAVP